MKIFKNIKKQKLWTSIAVISGLILIAGCSKFLERKPLTATLDDLKQGSLEGQSYGMYSSLRYFAGFSGLPWIDFHSVRDDDAEKGSSLSDGAEITAQFENFNYSKEGWAVETYWNDHFAMINLANTQIQTADSLKVSDPASLRNVGEALFFRAYAYFELVKNYGDVPLLNFRVYKAAEAIQPKSPASKIYEQIDKDLALAVQYLPANWNNASGVSTFPGRLTSGAANTLWAQTQLFRKNWSQTAALCRQVIASGQYSLSSTYAGIWKDGLNGAGKNGPESIFEMQSNVGPNRTNNNGSSWGTSQNIRQGGATSAWNLGWGWNTPTQVLVDAWEPSDPRRSGTILFSGQSDDPTTGGYGATLPPYDPNGANGGIQRKYWNKKVYSDPAMRAFTGMINNAGEAAWINHRILRYADVILMLAEAANETGDGATAAEMVEKIRARARGGNGNILPKITFQNQAQMRTAIKNERRFEFAMEGYRFYDLVRWGDAEAALGSLGYTNRNRFYPIPQKAIDASNGVLKQNPDY